MARATELETALKAAMRAIEIYAATPNRAFNPDEWQELTLATNLARKALHDIRGK